MSDGPYIEEKLAEVRLGTMTENFDMRCPQVTDNCTCFKVELVREEADGLETLSEPGQYID